MNTNIKKKKKKEAYYAKEIFVEIGSAVLTLYIFLITVVQPFYYRSGYTSIGSDKYFFFRYTVLAMLMLGVPLFIAYLTTKPHIWNYKNWYRSLSVTDWFVLAYGSVVCLSYLCSQYREEAFWGNQNGWYMGFVTQMSLVVMYFLISRMWKPAKESLHLFLGTAFVVFLLGFLNRFSVYPIAMEGANPNFISTLGNINWYCGYWSVAFPVGLAWFWHMGSREIVKGQERWQEILLGIFVIMGFATGVTQGSSSGFLALEIMFLTIFGLSVTDGKKMQRFWLICFLLCITCQIIRLIRIAAPKAVNYKDGLMDFVTDTNVTLIIGIVTLLLYGIVYRQNQKQCYAVPFFRVLYIILLFALGAGIVMFLALIICNTKHPGSIGVLSSYPAFTFNEKWGNKRGIIWWSGIQIFASQPFLGKWIGVGPDAFCAYAYSDACSVTEQIVGVFGASKLTNAHNEWLTILVNTGILGMASYAGIMMSSIYRFIKGGREKHPALYFCGLSIISYVFHNMVSFQQALNYPLMFLLLGVGECFMKREEKR